MRGCDSPIIRMYVRSMYGRVAHGNAADEHRDGVRLETIGTLDQLPRY